MLRRTLTCILLSPLLAAQDEPLTFDGRTATEWKELLSSNDLSHTDVLIAGGKAALPMLRVLIRSKADYIPWRALHACAEIGPDAAPLSDDLLRILREEDDEWIKQNGAAKALLRIGRRDVPFIQELARHAVHTKVRSLRSTCIDALAEMKVDVASRVLGETSIEEAHAAQVLGRVGESCIPTLVAACRESNRNRRIAEDALIRIGWPAVTPLERADLAAIAQKVLLRHPLQHVPMREHNELRTRDGTQLQQPAVDRVPEIVWWQSTGDGYRFAIYRVEEGPKGIVVYKLESFRRSRRGTPARLEVTATTIPRARALDAARQLAAIQRLELRHLDGARGGSFAVTGQGFSGGARIVQDSSVLLDAHFSGSPSTRNAALRFASQAATGVLQQMLHGQSERPRTFDNNDRALLQRMSRHGARISKQLENIRELAGAPSKDERPQKRQSGPR